MAVKVDYDTDKRIIYITEAPVNGLVELDVQVDLYSDIKEDWKNNPALNKFRIPITSVGGNPLPGSKTLGDTYFLNSQWKIRPYEADHKLAINGNLFSEDGSSVVIPTIGNYNVLVEMFVSNLSDSSIQQLTEIEYSVYNGGVHYDEVNGRSGQDYPVGTPFDKVNNLVDTQVLIATQKLPYKVFIYGTINLTGAYDFSDYRFEGVSNIQSQAVIAPEINVARASFKELIVSGTLDGDSDIDNCVIGDITYLNGHIHNSLLKGKITLGGGIDALIDDCKQLDFNIEPEVDMGGLGQNLIMTEWTGIVHISNLSGANAVGIGLSAGRVVLEDTVTNGIIHVSGDGNIVDSNGDTIPTGIWNGGPTVINATSDYQFEQLFNKSGALSPEEQQQLRELYASKGLSLGNPASANQDNISVPGLGIDIEVTKAGDTITYTRQP